MELTQEEINTILSGENPMWQEVWSNRNVKVFLHDGKWFKIAKENTEFKVVEIKPQI